uniref:Pentatricopeptide repeat-containing protein n=1 Tax=Cucumis melo TaxID=3656 RepID=A0A9I9DW29_CUCME
MLHFKNFATGAIRFHYISLIRCFSNSNSSVNGSTAPSKDDYFAAIHHISHIVRRDFYMERTLNKLRISYLNSELVFRVLRACSNCGTESFRFFNWACSHNPSYQPTTLELEELVKTLARTRKYTTMWKVLLQMKTQNLKISPETISFIIQEYGKQGLVDNAVTIFNQCSKSIDCPQTVEVYNALLFALCEVCKLGLCPDINTYKILIPATSKVGRIDEAFRLLNCCIEDGHVPFPSLYGPIIKGMCKRGQFDDAFCFFGDMKHKGHPPNRPVYTMLITMCGRGGRFVDAANYLMEMAELGLPPISRCFDMVTDGLKSCGKHDLAKKIEKLEVSIRGI